MSVKLNNKQQFIADQLVELFKHWDLPARPDIFFIGGLFAMKKDHRDNPDWMAQSANSFREIFYHLFRKIYYPDLIGTDLKKIVFEKFGSVARTSSELERIGRIYGMLSDIAHHKSGKGFPTPREYEHLVSSLEKTFFSILTRQLDIHDRLEVLLQRIQNVEKPSIVAEEILNIIDVNTDTSQYFFSIVTSDSFPFLVQEGFFNDLHRSRKKLAYTNWISFELFCLQRLSSEIPNDITNVILQTQVHTDSFPLLTRSTFIRCLAHVPLDMARKILNHLLLNGWLFGTEVSNEGYSLEEFVKKILIVAEWEMFLVFLQIRFTPLQTDIEVPDNYSARNFSPFLFDTDYCKHSLEGISKVPYSHQKLVLHFLSTVLIETAIESSSTSHSDFEFLDRESFLSFNLYNSNIENVKDSYDLGIVTKLIVAYYHLAKKYVTNKRTSRKSILDIINLLPSSQMFWKVRYLLLSSVSLNFENEFIEETIKFTQSETPFDYLSGAEYELGLLTAFPHLSNDSRSLIFETFISYYEKSKRESLSLESYVRPLFSLIAHLLSQNQISELEVLGIKLIDDYQPTASVGRVIGGLVVDQSPVKKDELSKVFVIDIISNLKTVWHPDVILDSTRNDNFLRPTNATGLAKLLSKDLINRPDEYLDHLFEFIDSGKIGFVYLNGILDGIKELIVSGFLKNHTNIVVTFISKLVSLNADGKLFDVFIKAENKRRGRSDDIALNSLLRRILDIMDKLIHGDYFLSIKTDREILHEFSIILEKLLLHEDPNLESEELASASMTVRTGNLPTQVSDSFSMAINSIRGKAFASYILFLRKIALNSKLKQSIDIQWRGVINSMMISEQTRALHSQFGYYTGDLISLDRDWYYHTLTYLWDCSLPYYLQIQVWNGFLSSNAWIEYLESSLFQKTYRYWLRNPPIPEIDRRYFQNFDEGLTRHFFAYYFHDPSTFIKSSLFNEFYKYSGFNTHKRFVDILGRYLVSRVNEFDADVWPEDLAQTLIELWSRYLHTYDNLSLFDHFGFWYCDKNGIFDSAEHLELIIKTLEKSSGSIAHRHLLEKQLVKYAKIDPPRTLRIAELVLLEGLIGNNEHNVHLEKYWKALFEYLYKSKVKLQTKALASRLIEEGGKPFWILKEN